MRKYYSLTRALLKSSLGMLSDGKEKKRWLLILYAIIAISLIPLLYLIYSIILTLIEAVAPLQQTGTIIALALHIICMVIFIFSIFLIPAIFYFSKDSETLLTLPLKPETILASKFTTTLVYEYAFTAFVMAPVLMAYEASGLPTGILFYLFALLIFVIIPMYPLVVSSLITMLVMRFIPFFKNRDRFNLIGGIITIVLAFAFSFSMQTLSMDQDTNMLVSLVMSGGNSLIELFSYVFPVVSFATNALVDSNIVSLLLFITITIAALFIFLLVGKFIYFKGAIGFGETSSSRKKLSKEDVSKASQRHNVIWTYTLKELKLVVRTPVYALNCLGTCLVFPILLFALTFTDDSLGSSLYSITAITKIDHFISYVIIVGLAVGFFFGTINLISSTAISREGSNYTFMKYIPLSYANQIHAKVLSGIIVAIITVILTMVVMAFLLPISPFYYVIATLCSLITIIISNYLAILIDLAFPKLVWEQEAAAVKRNIGGIVIIFLSIALCAALVFIFLQLPSNNLDILSIIMVILMAILAFICYKLVGKAANKMMLKL